MIDSSPSDPNPHAELHPGPHLHPLAVLLAHLQTLTAQDLFLSLKSPAISPSF